MKTPLVDSLGLKVLEYDKGPGYISERYINAEDLERFLEGCPVVRSKFLGSHETHCWTDNKNTIYGAEATHTARLICVQEIKREPLKEDRTVNFTSDYKSYDFNGVEFGSKFAGKKCRVTVEEIL